VGKTSGQKQVTPLESCRDLEDNLLDSIQRPAARRLSEYYNTLVVLMPLVAKRHQRNSPIPRVIGENYMKRGIAGLKNRPWVNRMNCWNSKSLTSLGYDNQQPSSEYTQRRFRDSLEGYSPLNNQLERPAPLYVGDDIVQAVVKTAEVCTINK